MTESVTSNLTTESTATDYQSLIFVIKQLLGKAITIVPVRVTAVTGSGSLTSCPYVSVQPLLNQITGNGQAVPHGIIYNVPCWRLQGGTSAAIIDPGAGDIGLMLVAYRDASALVTTDQNSPGSLQGGSGTYNPGSAAQFDWSAGFYLGGWLNGEVTTYLQLTASLCKVVAPTINLNGLTVDSSGNVSTAGNITSTGGDVKAGTISLTDHIHGGVTTGGGSTGAPTG